MAREFPVLYSRDKKGKLISWRAWADDDMVCMEHGAIDGKKTLNRTRALGTNAGRANARDGAAQALSEVESAWKKKIKTDGYFESMGEAANSIVYLPMLAHPYEKNGKKRKVLWSDGVFCQPKLNGLRGLSFVSLDGVKMLSRQGTEWTGLEHIKAALAASFRVGAIIDGEVYLHGVPLQTLNSLIKRDRAESAALEYHIYDMPSIAGGFEDRYAQLSTTRLYGTNGPYAIMSQSPLKLVPTKRTSSEEETFAIENYYVGLGYEGLIVRQCGRSYEWNDRTDSLLKIKRFQDAEFSVIDVLGRENFSVGAMGGVWIVDKFVCKNNTDDQTFETVPIGTMEQRATWWRNRELLKGQQAIVRFQERSVSGLPQGNPTMRGFRLAEDKPVGEEAMWD